MCSHKHYFQEKKIIKVAPYRGKVITSTFLLIIHLLMFSNAYAQEDSNTPNFILPPPYERSIFSDNGHILLSWKYDKATIFEIQQSNDVKFSIHKTIYKGSDRSTFVSGLPDGDYFFRIRISKKEWSETLKLEVRHLSLRTAYILFALGAFVFLSTAFVIIHGVYLVEKRERT